jgi:Sir2 family
VVRVPFDLVSVILLQWPLLTALSAGAGISVQAGIPDFRSQEGLFKTLKRDNPREALTSGKDLFDASVFHVRFSFIRCVTPI